MKRIIAFLLTIVLIFVPSLRANCCDEEQSEDRIARVLFGNNVSKFEGSKGYEMLSAAVYICCEQYDTIGQAKLDYLKSQKVGKIPSIKKITIPQAALFSCTHNYWEYSSDKYKKQQDNRHTLLIRTVNKVFDFDNKGWFGSKTNTRDESFAQFLYYLHILSDYLADSPKETEIGFDLYDVPAYNGNSYIELNGNKPTIINTKPTGYSKLETNNGRAGTAFVEVSKDTIDAAGPRPSLPDPYGWNQQQYPDYINTDNGVLYNRCHLIAHAFDGNDTLNNLVIGTRYLNEGMGEFENKIENYIKDHPENHVLYKVTPIYVGDNLIPSGVQMEAYSVEDRGAGVSFNVYCYNVQPGIYINYSCGDTALNDTLYYDNKVIPFAIPNASDKNPDLIYELKTQITGFVTKKDSNYYSLVNEMDRIHNEALQVGTNGEKDAKVYEEKMVLIYELYNTLEQYIPLILKNENFFKNVFK
ncbi:MAG: DNA/RNA non-specific endonuclease [Lachnospiraceae bacterium]|nr:DNA/RNA non-specific endonuclease [Lachnospiraceae bacterium]